jgi:hypothetical protein
MLTLLHPNTLSLTASTIAFEEGKDLMTRSPWSQNSAWIKGTYNREIFMITPGRRKVASIITSSSFSLAFLALRASICSLAICLMHRQRRGCQKMRNRWRKHQYLFIVQSFGLFPALRAICSFLISVNSSCSKSRHPSLTWGYSPKSSSSSSLLASPLGLMSYHIPWNPWNIDLPLSINYFITILSINLSHLSLTSTAQWRSYTLCLRCIITLPN